VTNWVTIGPDTAALGWTRVDVIRLLARAFVLVRTLTTFARNEQVEGSIPLGGSKRYAGQAPVQHVLDVA
jgi:hypothetical protein